VDDYPDTQIPSSLLAESSDVDSEFVDSRDQLQAGQPSGAFHMNLSSETQRKQRRIAGPIDESGTNSDVAECPGIPNGTRSAVNFLSLEKSELTPGEILHKTSHRRKKF